MKTGYITRRATFSSAHRLHSSELTAEENRITYGKCNNPNAHGHNYELEVTVRMPIDSKTGMAMNLVDLRTLMEEKVCAVFDHKHLDLDTGLFSHRPSTAENICVVIWDILKPLLPSGALYEVKLKETENNTAFYRGE